MAGDSGYFFVEADKLEPSHGYNIEVMCEDANYPLEVKKADAELMVDAENTYSKSGFLPSELHDQTTQLREGNERLINALMSNLVHSRELSKAYHRDDPRQKIIKESIREAEQLLKEIEINNQT